MPISAIPFFTPAGYSVALPLVGIVPIDAWAILVCAGILVGLEMARLHALRTGLEPRDLVDGVIFVLVCAFVSAHVFSVVLYHPSQLLTDPGSIFRVWEGFASFGGFIGASVGAVAFYTWIRPRSFWPYADAIAWGFPFGWTFGRLGCGVVHDHVGSKTTLPIGMDFDHGFRGTSIDPAPWADGVRHELGLEEAVAVAIISVLWLGLARRQRREGFYVGLLALLYGPIRFGIDCLRNTDLGSSDARYFGFTPAQYGCVVLVAAGAWILQRPSGR